MFSCCTSVRPCMISYKPPVGISPDLQLRYTRCMQRWTDYILRSKGQRSRSKRNFWSRRAYRRFPVEEQLFCQYIEQYATVTLHYIDYSLLYGLETCPLRSSDNNSLGFIFNRFFMKLFKRDNLEIVTYCRMQFNFDLPALFWKKEVMFLLENINCAMTFCCTLVVNVAYMFIIAICSFFSLFAVIVWWWIKLYII